MWYEVRKERGKYSSMLSESYELDFASILNLKIVVFSSEKSLLLFILRNVFFFFLDKKLSLK